LDAARPIYAADARFSSREHGIGAGDRPLPKRNIPSRVVPQVTAARVCFVAVRENCAKFVMFCRL
jgi:hypothetical protein